MPCPPITRRFRFSFFFAVLSVLTPVWKVQAGVVLTIETTQADKVHTSRISVEGNLLSMEFVGQGAHNATGKAIFRGDRDEMVVVDHGRKSYFVMDRQTLDQMTARLEQAMNQMEQMMQNLPPEAREQMRRMQASGGMPGMPGMPGDAAVPQFEVRKTDQQQTYNGYPCTSYEVVRNGNRVRELWVTDWDRVSGAQEMAGLYQEMTGFLQDMAESLRKIPGGMAGAVFDQAFAGVKTIQGFPVVMRELGASGEVVSESVLTSVEEQEVDPADFDPPKGYRQERLMPEG